MIVAQCTYCVLVWDKDGNLTSQGGEFPMHSFVSNYTKTQEIFAKEVNATLTSTTGAGTLYKYTAPLVVPQINAGMGSSDYGIVVGTGSVAATINDYQLGGPLTHGTGLNQLYYTPVAFDKLVTTTTDAYFICRRHFLNNSSGSITLTESGIVGAGMNTTTTRILMVRDVFPASITIPVSGYAEVRYKFGITTI